MDEGQASGVAQRVLLKLSGEMLAGRKGLGLDPEVLDRFAAEIAEAAALGVGVGVVIGGGNIFRGLAGAGRGVDRVRGDHMGMLATAINALALQDALERRGQPAEVMTALVLQRVGQPFEQRTALRLLDDGTVLIFACGTGCPFFSTDTAAALRAVEIGASLLLKGTKVDGVYDRDPARDPTAVRYPRISYGQVLQERLRVLDLTATSLCMENNLPIVVFDMNRPGELVRAVRGEPVGTLVGPAAPSTPSR